MIDFVTTLDILSKLGLLGGLILAIYGGMHGWYIWKGAHEKLIEAITTGHTSEVASLRQSQEDHIATLRKEVEKLQEDRDYWRNISIRVLTANEKTLNQMIDITQKQS